MLEAMALNLAIIKTAMKGIHHPDAGLPAMDFSSFAVEGRPLYNPASADDAERLRVRLDGYEDWLQTSDVGKPGRPVRPG